MEKKKSFKDIHDIDEVNLGMKFIELALNLGTAFTNFLWQKFYLLLSFNAILFSIIFLKQGYLFTDPIRATLSFFAIIFSLVMFLVMGRSYEKMFYLY